MIKSMTGFGRGEVSGTNYKVTVEMKSVNHRYLDTTIKMHKKLNFFEANLKNILKRYIVRGKVDIYVSYEDISQNTIAIQYNENVAKRYLDIFMEMADRFGLENDIKVSNLSRYPEVIVTEDAEPMEDELSQLVGEAFEKALVQLDEARITEGANLFTDLTEKLDRMLVLVEYINSRSESIIMEYRNKLEEKIKDMLGDVKIDENRLATEVVIYADKACVDEEMVRLVSHIKSMKETLIKGHEEGIGKKLDFIAQEMNREANTTLSKANNIEISQQAIELKTLIEKVREQIQNIE